MRVVSRLFAGLVCIAAILTVPTTVALARVRPDVYAGNNGIIAFVRANQIYTMNPNGTDLRQLTSGPARNYNPIWSPNGHRLAYVHEWPPGTRSIWEMNWNGSGQQQWTTSPVWGAPAWTPNGQTLTFSRGTDNTGVLEDTSASTPMQPASAIYGGNTDQGSNVTAVYGYNPSWSSGNELAFTANPTANNGAMCDGYDLTNCIEIYQPATQTFSEVVGDGGGGGCASCTPYWKLDFPRWAPDSSDLLFQWISGGPPAGPNDDYWRLGDTADLYDPVGAPVALPGSQNGDWSPEGNYIVFANAKPGNPATIYIADSDGTDSIPIAGGYEPDWQPAVVSAPKPAAHLFCVAAINHPRPRVNSLITVNIRSLPNIVVFTRTHYRGRVHAKGARTNSLGQAQIAYAVRPFAPGVRVPVTVRAIKAGRLASCETFFTPR